MRTAERPGDNGITLTHVLHALVQAADDGRAVSGQALAVQLAVSRAAIWKAIERLRREGYVIAAVTGDGYRLRPRPDGLLAGELQAGLGTAKIGRTIVYHPHVASTNSLATQMATQGAPHGTIVVAGSQSAGRGRLGRAWLSPAGGLYLSVVVRPDIALAQLPLWTLAVALAAAQGLDQPVSNRGPRLGLKWPNDILANGRKIAGILCEAAGDTDHTEWIVAGIGVNVAPLPALAGATSLKETGLSYELREVAQNLLRALDQGLPLRLSEESVSDLLARWMARATGLHQPVVISRSVDGRQQPYAQGIFRGVQATGAALIEDQAGHITVCPAGDLSFQNINPVDP